MQLLYNTYIALYIALIQLYTIHTSLIVQGSKYSPWSSIDGSIMYKYVRLELSQQEKVMKGFDLNKD